MKRSVYFRGESVLLDGVDFKRVAREFLKSQFAANCKPPKDVGQAMDIMARFFGFESHHALLKQAKNTRAAEHQNLQPYQVFEKEALNYGASFPKDMPDRFNSAWRKTAVDLFEKAMSKRDKTRMEVIALVGASGSGKTMLARYLVKKHGGAVLDASLTSILIPEKVRTSGAILVYDRLAELPPRPPRLTSFEVGQAKLEQYRQSVRSSYNPFGMSGLYGRVRDDMRTHRECAFVYALPTEDEVMDLLTSSYGLGGHWSYDAAHVLNLDTMSIKTLVPPPFSEWAAKREAERAAGNR